MSNVNVGFFIEDIPEKLYFAGKNERIKEIMEFIVGEE